VAEIFVDTSGWGNLIDSQQPFHRLASAVYRNARQQGARFVTTNYVITELVALMSSPLRIPKPKIVAFVESVKTSPLIEMIIVDLELDNTAWELFKRRQDKDWSLVDCASFVVMQQRGISASLTSDRHFEQAGSIRLLK